MQNAMNNLLAQAPQQIIVAPKAGQFASLTGIQVGNLVSTAITVILIVAGLIFFFMLIIGGIQWITSGGDKAKTEGARNQITAALIGLVIVFAAWAIASLLGSIFGINIFNFTTPNIGGSGTVITAP